jgi:uncharacterized protein (DUF1015 family)
MTVLEEFAGPFQKVISPGGAVISQSIHTYPRFSLIKDPVPEIRPFMGLLYDSTVAGPSDRVTAPPYDVISPVDQDRYYRLSPFNVVRLILGKDEPGDDASMNKYTRASSHLRSWVRDGILKPTPRPSVFPYELDFHLGGGKRRVRGVIVEVALEPWGGSIVPHERTFSGPIVDRLRLIRAVQANLSPIYAVLSGTREATDLSAFLDKVTADPPDRETTDEAGTRHRLWIWDEDPDQVTASMEHRSLMIADGHHRYTVALAHREEMRGREGPGPWDRTMMFVVDASAEDPPVLPIHRAVLGDSLPAFEGERVRDLAEVLATLNDDDVTYGIAHLEEGEVVHRVSSLEGSPPTVCALHDRILDRAPGIELRFLPDAVTAESLVSSRAARAAYLLPPTKVERVWDVVGKGGKLPQKSTYFWPKPRTGLVIRPFSG